MNHRKPHNTGFANSVIAKQRQPSNESVWQPKTERSTARASIGNNGHLGSAAVRYIAASLDSPHLPRTLKKKTENTPTFT